MVEKLVSMIINNINYMFKDITNEAKNSMEVPVQCNDDINFFVFTPTKINDISGRAMISCYHHFFICNRK